MLTFSFKDISEDEYKALKDQVGKGNEGLLHDLLIDESGYYALVLEEKSSEFIEFLDKVGIDPK